MRKIWMVTASCLMAASFIGPAALAQNAEAEAAAARVSAAAAAARATAQVSPNDTLEKICRIGPRSREVLEELLWTLDHQMAVQGEVGDPPKRLDDHRSHAEGRHEMRIHGIDMNKVDVTTDQLDLIHIDEIGRAHV